MKKILLALLVAVPFGAHAMDKKRKFDDNHDRSDDREKRIRADHSSESSHDSSEQSNQEIGMFSLCEQLRQVTIQPLVIQRLCDNRMLRDVFTKFSKRNVIGQFYVEGRIQVVGINNAGDKLFVGFQKNDSPAGKAIVFDITTGNRLAEWDCDLAPRQCYFDNHDNVEFSYKKRVPNVHIGRGFKAVKCTYNFATHQTNRSDVEKFALFDCSSQRRDGQQLNGIRTRINARSGCVRLECLAYERVLREYIAHLEGQAQGVMEAMEAEVWRSGFVFDDTALAKIELLQGIAQAIRDPQTGRSGRIHATREQWNVFLGLPQELQAHLGNFIAFAQEQSDDQEISNDTNDVSTTSHPV